MIPCSLLLVVLAAGPAPAAPAPVALAAPDFSTVNVSPEIGRFLAEHLAQQLADGGVRVITSREIGSLLGLQRQRDLLGCNEGASCIAELGNALGADGILLGDVARLGNTYQLNAKVLSADGVRLLARASATADSESGLVPAVNSIAHQLGPEVLRALGRQPKTVSPPPASVAADSSPAPEPPLRKYAWIPAAGAGVFAVGGTIFLGLAANDSQQLTAREGSVIPSDRAASLVTDGDRYQLLARIGYGVAGAALVTAAVMFLVPGHDAAPVTLAPTVNGVVLAGSFQ